MSSNEGQYHEEFNKRLKDSDRYVVAFARWMKSEGRHVKKEALFMSDSYAERMNHVDHGDIITGPNDGNQRLEVKHVNKNFNINGVGLRQQVLIMRQHAFDNADPPINLIYKLNNDMTCCAVFKAASQVHWGTMLVPDKYRPDRAPEMHYYVDKGLVDGIYPFPEEFRIKSKQELLLKMSENQLNWIAEQDERICRGLESVLDPADALWLEALMWCGHPDVKWDREKLHKITPLLKEYGKSEALIKSMRDQYVDWILSAQKTVPKGELH